MTTVLQSAWANNRFEAREAPEKVLRKAEEKAGHQKALQDMLTQNLGCTIFEAQQYIKTAVNMLARDTVPSVVLDHLAFDRYGFAMLQRLKARDHLLALVSA